MAIPNIDTFEQNVAEEIKKKEASFTDIASAGGTVENAPPQQKRGSLLVPVLLVVLLLVSIAGAGGYYYVFFMKNAQPLPAQEELLDTTVHLRDISATLEQSVGTSVEVVEKAEEGYVVTLREYTPVFAYMIRNESSFAEEIAVAVGSARDASTSTPPFSFQDVTMSNQNMRVGTSASSTVVYAFVSTNHLLLSSTTEGILSLRGGILKQ